MPLRGSAPMEPYLKCSVASAECGVDSRPYQMAKATPPIRTMTPASRARISKTASGVVKRRRRASAGSTAVSGGAAMSDLIGARHAQLRLGAVDCGDCRQHRLAVRVTRL